jgi:sugar diacid utilization regulator/GAF domain-containing protein
VVRASDQRRSATTQPSSRRAHPSLPDERAYLYQIIQTIGSGPDLDAILRGIVRLTTEATGCHASLIWFLSEDRLTLRASSAPYEHLAGAISMGPGEGLAGWVAKTRRSAFITEGALQDPRMKYFPEFEEERFQSLVSVPMFGRGGDVMGVISLHAEAPHEFVRADLDFLEHTASLIAGAVENARLYDDTAARVALLTDLSRLLQRIAGAPTIEDVFTTVSSGTRRLLSADRAEVYLRDADDQLRLRAADPVRHDERAIDAGTFWFDVSRDERARGGEGAQLLAATLWGEGADPRTMTAPLIAGDDRLGVVVVSAPASIPGADTALAAVAAHTAVTVKQHQLIGRLQDTNVVKDFFRALSRADAPDRKLEGMVERLGFDLGAEHLVIHVQPWRGARPAGRRRKGGAAEGAKPAAWRDLAGQVEARLDARLGAMFDHDDRSLQAVVTLTDRTSDEVVAVLKDIARDEGRETPLSIGISDICRGRSSYPQGFQEAAAAAEVGALIRSEPGVSTFGELGPYRYALSVEADDARDRSQQRLRLLVDYDRRRDTQLLDTLEGYLDHRGNVVATSRALFIHTNTLRQRLERIRRESGIDLEHEDWLSLAVATKVVKLNRLRGSAAPEGGTDG